MLPGDGGPLVRWELRFGSFEHLGRVVDSQDPGIGPAPSQDRGEVSRATAEVDDDLRIGMADPGDQLEAGSGAQIGEGQVGVGIPRHASAFASRLGRGHRCAATVASPSRSVSSGVSGWVIRQIQLPSSCPGVFILASLPRPRRSWTGTTASLGGGAQDDFDQIPVDLFPPGSGKCEEAAPVAIEAPAVVALVVSPKPADGRVVVVGAGVGNDVGWIVVGMVNRGVDLLIESELGDPHAGVPEGSPQVGDLVRDDPQVLGDDRHRTDPRLESVEQFDARGLRPSDR